MVFYDDVKIYLGSNEKYKVMFFKLGAMGDILMTTPLARALKEFNKNIQIDYYCGKHYSAILKDNPYIDNIIEFDQDIFPKKNILEVAKLRKQIKKEKYTAAFILDKHWIFSLFVKLCGISNRIGFNRRKGSLQEGRFNTDNVEYKFDPIIHEIKYYLEMAYYVGAASENTNMVVKLLDEELKVAKELIQSLKLDKEKIIAVMPGGANNPGVGDDPIRRWKPDNFVTLIDMIVKDGYKVLMIGGLTDKNLYDYIFNKLKNKDGVYNLAGQLKLKSSIAMLKNCKAVICQENGLLHLASTVNDRIVCLCGPTHPLSKGPLHKRSVCIWEDADIWTQDFELYGTKPTKEFFTKIKPEHVYDSLQEVLK
jgi:lipopolysaccharide heptosyltransferase II